MVAMNSDVAPDRRLYLGRLGRANHEPANRTFRFAARLAGVILRPIARLHLSGQENLPTTGAAIIVPNHLCDLDPLVVGYFLAWGGRWPHFLARANLFTMPVLGRLLRALEQIPVERGSVSAAGSLAEAQHELEAGKVVIVYPEGTFTYDPDEWPMAGHTGAARLALRTGAPVVPIGQWGANFIIPPRHKRRPKLLGRSDVTVHAGARLDLADLVARGESDRHAVHDATVRIMDAITHEVSAVRDLPAPHGRWHPGRKKRVDPAQAVL
ncbi:1-acylglycerol-3-phosphate O-acyltransferase, putative [Propionibacterium freudenreichii]|nr:1-acylglycerol-3-phosphate O-acyltransferase, putative [Propionibacterium freudenreichii]MCT3000384.1 1-acyl-sn-glycerol-3-phosphate acyltransferase [Propionibacterium freudenreichii]MCT3017699.1 1-acyl-sn-glycerol-3-phosphate acyltransferase [Propionibacterium freudenreichii]SCQ45946.1 1-acylglycerol-3-phosphate O-acyltransferase, putayive [Propionibacterium freudenreichii]SCQ50677.1 1-acylglycerol-3-phosphate O-acyltransferase, putayive [Propionibacterium freudenreichii]